MSTSPPVLDPNSMRPQTSQPGLPSLQPLSFPFVPGHRILVKAQSVLEQACFDFAKKYMPRALQENHWSCAEAVELNVWTKKFKSQESVLVDAENKVKLLDRAKFYESIEGLRHTAVHRRPATAKELAQFLADGEKLVDMLGDELALAELSGMASEAKRTISDMESHRSMLQTKLAGTTKKIADQRADLDRQEKSAIADMVKSDEEYQVLAGVSLEQRLLKANVQDKLALVGTPVSAAYYADNCSEEVDFNNDSEEDDFGFLSSRGIPVMTKW